MESLLLDFINSRWAITHKPFLDPLDSGVWLEELLKKWAPGFVIPKNIPVVDEFKKLRKLLAEAVCDLEEGESISSANMGKINHYLSLSDSKFQLERNGIGYKMIIKPVEYSWKDVLSKLARSFAEFVSVNDISRLKQCCNEECRWIFYDESKNKTRKWCCNTCASLMKVRRYRRKDN